MSKKILGVAFFTCFLFWGSHAQVRGAKLRFAFMTDIHLNYKNAGSCFSGFRQALDTVKNYSVDFIMLGGDCVDIDGFSLSFGDADSISSASKVIVDSSAVQSLDVNDFNLDFRRANSLYGAFKGIVDSSATQIYPAIGNHDRFFDIKNGYREGDELFKKFFRNSYYTFEQKGVRFFVLNSVQLGGGGGGYYVGKQQMEWLQSSLKSVPQEAPVVVITHVPVYSIYYPVVEGKYVFVDVIANYRELLKAFDNHNLKLVLQGHQHLYEEIYSRGVQYITGGAVCAGWWSGAFWGTEEGFLIVDVDENNSFSWNYVDYGWTVKK
jgi:Icc-related predicted phosphoesterase